MSIRKLALRTATSAVGLLVISGASASASTHLRLDPGNIPFSGSTTITNTSSGPATLTLTGVGNLTCNETKFDVDVNQHTSATSITGTLTTLTFTSCTDTIPVLAIPHCTLSPTSPLPLVHITANAAPSSTILVTDPVITCSIAGSTTSMCYYTAASATGTGNNTASTLAFSSVGVTTVGGSGSLGAACGSTGTFSVTLNHIVQGGTNRTVTILPTA